MTIDRYIELQKLIAQELNVKEVHQRITNTEKGQLFVCVTEKGDIYLLLGDDKIEGKRDLIEKLVENIYDGVV